MQANQSLLEEEEEEGPEGFLDETPKAQGSSRGREEHSDDEVPQSFMVENPVKKTPVIQVRHHKGKRKGRQANILPMNMDDSATLNLPPRPSEIDTPLEEPPLESYGMRKPIPELDQKQLALWKWVNVYDLDLFLQDVYRYYEGKGIYSIALSRGLHLL